MLQTTALFAIFITINLCIMTQAMSINDAFTELPKKTCSFENQNNTSVIGTISSYCTLTNLEDFEAYAEKLFWYDHNIFGVITPHNFRIQFFIFYPHLRQIKKLDTDVIFEDRVPNSACTDKYTKTLYITFPDEYYIAAFKLRNVDFEKYVLEEQFRQSFNDLPYEITCSKKSIYVTFKGSDEFMILNSKLQQLDTISLAPNLYETAEKVYRVGKNLGVFVDGYSQVGIFKYKDDDGKLPYIDSCHFYNRKMCLEDVNVIKYKDGSMHIFVSDSCESIVKHYIYSIEKNTFQLQTNYKLEGRPSSTIVEHDGFIFVATINPPKIYVINQSYCK